MLKRWLVVALVPLALGSSWAQSPSPNAGASPNIDLPELDLPGGGSPAPAVTPAPAASAAEPAPASPAAAGDGAGAGAPPGPGPAPSASPDPGPPPPPIEGPDLPPDPASTQGPPVLKPVTLPSPAHAGHKGHKDGPKPSASPGAPRKRRITSSSGGGTPRGLIPPRKQFTSAVECAKCHDDLYDQWALSMHARSWDDPLFKKALAKAQAARGTRIREQCYACHAPIALATGDFSFKKAVTREGITCDVCHSITAVDSVYDAPGHFHMNPGIQHGPRKDSNAPHPWAYSYLITQSRFCAACHQGKLDAHADFLLFDTYGEWERSPYNASPSDVRTGFGRPEVPTRCQDCHMPGFAGPVAKDGPFRSEARGHQFPGAQTESMVGSALTFSMTARKSPDRRTLFVTVQTHNKQAGHMIPTDFPDRRLAVEVVGISRDYREMLREVRRYGKIFQDSKGNSPVPFWKAAGIVNDNRINPNEVRTEHFTFQLTGDLAEVRAQLQYWHVGEDLMKAYGTKIQPMVVEERTKQFAR